MKIVSYKLAFKFKEVAEKHGVVLPDGNFTYDCFNNDKIIERTDRNARIAPGTDTWTADELMDWFMAHKITIQIIIMNDQYAAVFHGNLSDPIAYSKNKNMFEKTSPTILHSWQSGLLRMGM